MTESELKISDDSHINIPLRNLISMIALTGLSVWEPPKSVSESIVRMRDIEIQLKLLEQKVKIYTEIEIVE